MSLESLEENLRFLIIEVEGQISLTARLLESCQVALLEEIAAKDDYIDNLKSVVEKKCFSRLAEERITAQEDLNTIRAIHIMAVNLERIGDFCVNIAKQTRYLASFKFLDRLEFRDMFETIEKAMAWVMPVFQNRNLSGALNICRSEYHLDQMFKSRFDRIMTALGQGKDIEDLLTTLFIFRYLERIGDALLNIGEALLFAIKGEKLKIEQYETLQETLSNSQLKATLPEVELSAILGSRSGCRISRIQPKHGNQMQGIFKEGNKKKIRREHENMRQWEAIRPGLVPKIFGYHENDGSAALIVEHLSGFTLEETLLNSDEETLNAGLKTLMNTMGEVWRQTLRPGPFSTDYIVQLEKRLKNVKQVHPQFERGEKSLGDLNIPSSRQLISACSQIEKSISAPCHVFIHGDFNVNNVFYDAPVQAIRYIDLYRSRFADYVQDASVFLASNYRLPFFEGRVRNRLNRIIDDFLNFFKSFSMEINDAFFEARMALALVRSFYTSTRFELNPDFSRSMFLSAHFLMEKLVSHHEPWEEFTMPRKVLFY
jgi:phosphate uptake regulator